MPCIQEEVKRLKEKFKTIDPFLIAEKLNIIVHIRYMHLEINGFYKYQQRNRFIVINKNLSDEMQKFVCAHELGHAILHSDINTPFFKRYTLFSVAKVEMEANTFAVELLLLDANLDTNITIQEASAMYEVPKEVIHLKKIKRS